MFGSGEQRLWCGHQPGWERSCCTRAWGRAPVGLSPRDQLGSAHTLFIPGFPGRKASSAAICQPPGPPGCNGSWGKHLAHLPWANNIVQIFCRRQLSFLMPPDAWRAFCSFCLYCTCWFLCGVSEGRTCHPTRYCFLLYICLIWENWDVGPSEDIGKWSFKGELLDKSVTVDLL